MRIEAKKDFGSRECPACAVSVPANSNRCPICGYFFPAEPRPRRTARIAAALLMLFLLALMLAWGLLR